MCKKYIFFLKFIVFSVNFKFYFLSNFYILQWRIIFSLRLDGQNVKSEYREASSERVIYCQHALNQGKIDVCGQRGERSSFLLKNFFCSIPFPLPFPSLFFPTPTLPLPSICAVLSFILFHCLPFKGRGRCVNPPPPEYNWQCDFPTEGGEKGDNRRENKLGIWGKKREGNRQKCIFQILGISLPGSGEFLLSIFDHSIFMPY